MDFMTWKELRRWFGESAEQRIERERAERLARRERGERTEVESLSIDWDAIHEQADRPNPQENSPS